METARFGLEQQIRFLLEKWSELYKWYCSRISQRKIEYDARKLSVSLATPENGMADEKGVATFGGGCFWCTDALFKQLRGVASVVSGYAGGKTDNPTYEQMHSQHTGHAEVVQVTFDSSVITYRELLEIFYATHDPTTKDRQGNDVGPEYRSIILYEGDEQKKIAEDATKAAAKLWENPITTEIVPLDKFWPAEDYHQDFFAKNPEVGYCQVVINPKLDKFRSKFAAKLKS